MHTATQLKTSMFDVELDERPASVSEIFPSWDRSDRFGVVVHSSYGALGASLLIQAAIAEFFQFRRGAGLNPMYPEIYAFHVGADHGDLSVYDFWPFHKEVVVEAEPSRVLHAINDRAITRLAVPDGPHRHVDYIWPERLAVLDRTRTVLTYDSSGRTAGADISLTANSTELEYNTAATLDLPNFIKDYVDDDQPDVQRWVGRVGTRRFAVTPDQLEAARLRHDAVVVDGMAHETYRREDTAFGLGRLIP